jgi:hypothetical protein
VLESLIEALGPRHVLLVLDNFEQVLDGAVMIPPVLAACPSVHVLVTSRVALRLDGEQQSAVPPLPVRNPDRRYRGRRETATGPMRSPCSSTARAPSIPPSPSVLTRCTRSWICAAGSMGCRSPSSSPPRT